MKRKRRNIKRLNKLKNNFRMTDFNFSLAFFIRWLRHLMKKAIYTTFCYKKQPYKYFLRVFCFAARHSNRSEAKWRNFIFIEDPSIHYVHSR